ncbi:MAG: NUDIX hydrolase [Gammaproteobacteria bacterium]
MKHCMQCGAALVVEIPPADNRPRHVCPRCKTVHYQNPRIVAGCIPEWQGGVLLCKRSIEPRSGLWTLPAGFMEMGETTVQAAARETLEEANARVQIGELYTVINLPHINQVYMMYRSRLLDLNFSPGSESEDVALFDPEEIPWDRLAFPTIIHTLGFFREDRRLGAYRLRTGTIIKEGGRFYFRDDPGVA